jgi:hypothetical protein
MDFSQYKIFRKEIEKEYGSYYKKYSFAFLVLDYLVQLNVHSKYNKSWVSDRDWSLYVDTMTRSDFTTYTYCLYLKVASYFVQSKSKGVKIHVAFENHKFPGLNKVIDKIAGENNWEVVFQGSDSLSNILDHILLKKISPYRCFISRKTKNLLSKFRKFDEVSWKELLDDSALMMQLNQSVQQDTIRTGQLIKRLGINIFINTGDSSGHARILIDSSKNYDSKTISFAHGYIAGDSLLGIAPIRSDKLILWTNKQFLEISDVIGCSQSKKLAYIGFPKKNITGEISTDSNTSLLVMGYIKDIVRNGELSAVFLDVIKTLKSLSIKVKLRLHPHERYNSSIIKEFVVKNNIELSHDDLHSEIASAEYVIGANTSVLVEAASCGKNVFEIEEFSNSVLDFEGVIRINAEQVKDIKLFSDRVNNDYLAFNEKELERNLKKLIISVYSTPNTMTESKNHDVS